MKMRKDEKGFSLVELLTVLAIISLLVAIVVPNLTGRVTKGKMHKAEMDIEAMETALSLYEADYGRYPGDIFPTEDRNYNGILDLDSTGAPGTGEDVGCPDCVPTTNTPGVLDRGDGVVNIRDLDYAFRLTAKSGPYMPKGVPPDPWGQPYSYLSPYTPKNTEQGLGGTNLESEDQNNNGRLDMINNVPGTGEDTGADHSANSTNPDPGERDGLLFHGEEKNMDNTTQSSDEDGYKDISPDGYARNLGHYIYSTGRNKKDESYSGYEDLNLNGLLDSGEDTFYSKGASQNLNAGYEDVGLDGIGGTNDEGEGDGRITIAGDTQNPSDFGTEDGNSNNKLDIGSDDINSWNDLRPWRNHSSYK